MTVGIAAAEPAGRGGRFLGVSAISPERVHDNARLVLEYGQPSTGESLRTGLFEGLNALQPWKFAYRQAPAQPLLTFGDEPMFHPKTLAHLMLREDLPREWQYPVELRDRLRQGVERGRALLAEFAPGTLDGLDFLIGEVVFGRCPDMSGGSLSDVIGVIWLGPKEDWSDIRWAEALAHEYTHHALFLEDMTRCIFPRPVSEMDTDGLVRSALLQRPRGYDKSWHSALVSLVLMQLADAHGGGHARYAHLLEPLSGTLHDLAVKEEFLTKNGKATLEEMRTGLKELEESWADA